MIIPQKILICSLGSIGCYYVRLIKKKWPDISIGVYRSGKGASYQEEAIIDEVFNSYSASLKWKPNACIISSPATYHLEQALIFAKEKIPLLIEKPVGTGLEPQRLWDELIALSDNVPIFIGYIFRCNPCAQYLKEKLIKEDIGKLIDADFYCGSWLPDWRPNQNYLKSVSSQKELGGGVLLELSHEIDLALWLMGKIDLISSNIYNTKALEIDTEDRALIVGLNSKKSLITIRLNFCTLPSRREVNIRGSKGEMVWDINLNKITTTNKKGLKVKEFDINKDDIFFTQLDEFFNGISGPTTSLCTLEESLNVLNLIRESYKITK